jgi:hypothetical protein
MEKNFLVSTTCGVDVEHTQAFRLLRGETGEYIAWIEKFAPFRRVWGMSPREDCVKDIYFAC